ncbi:MAG: hypothetical protein II184_09475, partial [Clostridia bacterium]|nr:hypothetical protein [Clostridia bacterium]
QDRFNYYKLALYLFSFSSFLDIMLLKNFDSNYLEAVKAKIEAYSAEYSNFLEKSIEGIEQIASASVQARAIQGLSAAEGFLGKQIAKIPNKNSKNKLGEKLIAGSEKLDAINLKAVDDTKKAFISLKDSGVQLFGGKIVQINRMYNEPLRLYVSEDKIYLPGN